ncbi:MAG: hypothetical protein U5P41_06980 [Gammaproteobacteria bacterium]|nr:hypothetical protein [Gammaproteobacteria bacterium]
MRSILLIIVLFIFITGGYLYWHQSGFPESNKTPAEDTPSAADREPVNTEIDSGERQALLEEARQYVAEITEHNDNPVEVESADDFVSRDEPISLFPAKEYETHTINDLKSTTNPDAPLTIVREQEQVEMTTASELLALSGGNLHAPVKVLEGGNVKQKTVGEVIKDRSNPESPISDYQGNREP